MSDRLKALADAGVSIWLDDLSRDRINSGNLADLVTESSVVGRHHQPDDLRRGAGQGRRPTTPRSRNWPPSAPAVARRDQGADHRRRPQRLRRARRHLTRATAGVDGRVSIEVDPGLAMDTDATIAQAADLWKIVDRPNTLIKIPATKPGLPAITASIAEGISVNVTLIFSLDRYRGVIDAYLSGLEQAAANGHDLSQIHSVASFFVSRVDTEVDKRLDAIGSDEAKALKGQAAIANARLAYALYEEEFSTRAVRRPGGQGRQPAAAALGLDRRQGPAYSDTMYVTELVVANTVNTMPEKTMKAFADHGEVHGRPGQRHRGRGAADPRRPGGARHRLRRRGRRAGDARAWRSSTRPGTSWSRPSQTALDEAKAGKDSPATATADAYDAGEHARPAEPTPRSAGSAAAADRRSLRAGDLRRHRGPVHQEADAGGLRPGQPRAAAAGFRPGRFRPPGLGAPGLREDRARRGQKHARTPFREEVWRQLSEGIRFVPGEIGDDDSFAQLARRSPNWTRRAAPAATTRSTCPSRRACSRPWSTSFARTGWPTSSPAAGAGW